jgi:hypothetical protein
MLDVTAVAVVEWDADVKSGIYAVAVADIPSAAAEFKLAHVELGILAAVDFGKGVVNFESQLAPSSFILDPSCHLSGGSALYYWFKDGAQQAKGDWVFTIGGYHRLFKPPPQYPLPPRLQISWSLGPLSIVGQAYFAITPSVAMAGGHLHASLSVGVLQAFLDAYLDVLINFKPFTFLASGGVSVGVDYILDLWFITKHIRIEIGATLVMQGPPFSGTCHVDFWVFGFDINFGADEKPEPARISLDDFYELVLQKGSRSASAVAPVPHVFACKSGLIPSSSTSSLSRTRRHGRRAVHVARASQDDDYVDDDNQCPMWGVHAGTFSFTISALFALSTVTVYPESKTPIIYQGPKADTVDIYSRPMYITDQQPAILSDLKVSMTFEGSGGSKGAYVPQWEMQAIITNALRALWDACKQPPAPPFPLPNNNHTNDQHS